MGLADILGTGLRIRTGIATPRAPRAPVSVRTPPFVPNQGTPQQIDLPDDSDSTPSYTPETEQLREALANPPEPGQKSDGTKIGKLRQVLGQIVSNVGPFLAGPNMAVLGQRLLNPALPDYEQKIAQLTALSNLSDKASARADLDANRKAAQANAALARQAAQANAIRQATEGNAGTVLPQFTPDENSQLKNLPLNPMSTLQTTASPGVGWNQQSNTPTANPLSQNLIYSTPKTPPVPTDITQTFDPNSGKPVGQAGTVQYMPQGKDTIPVLRYNPATQAAMTAKQKLQEKQDALDATKTEQFTQADADVAKKMGYPFEVTPGPATPTQKTQFQNYVKELQLNANKPARTPTVEEILLNQDKFPSAQVAQAAQMWKDQHRPPAFNLFNDPRAEQGRQQLAQSLANGELVALRQMASMRAGERTLVYGMAKQINPQFDPSLIDRKIEMQDYMDNKKGADAVQSFDQFLQHAGNSVNVVGGLANTNAALLNHSLNWLRANAQSSPQYRAALAAIQPVKKEFESFLLNNRALYQEDREDADKILSEDLPLKDFITAVQQMAHVADARYGALNQRYKKVMGTDYPNPFSGDALDAANKLGLNLARFGKSPSVSPGAVPQVGSTFNGGRVVKVTRIE